MLRNRFSGSRLFAWGLMLALAGCGPSGTLEPDAKRVSQERLASAGPMTAVDLGTLGGSQSSAEAINDSGQVVGWADIAGNAGTHAFLWQNGVMTDLDTLGGTESQALAINSSGQVAGYSTTLGKTNRHAFLWQNGVMTDLGTLGGKESYPRAMNEAGQVVGFSTLAGTEKRHAFLWKDGVMIDLGTLGGSQSVAVAINASGQVVGYSYIAGDESFHPFLWANGVMTDLGTFGGSYGEALDINDAGEIVGYALAEDDFLQRAFLWKDGVMTNLGGPAGGDSYAMAINESGQVIGYYSDSWFMKKYGVVWDHGVKIDLGTRDTYYCESYDINEAGQAIGCILGLYYHYRAQLWDDGALTDLGTLGGNLSTPNDINNLGQVAGSSVLVGDKVLRATLWTAPNVNHRPIARAGLDQALQCLPPQSSYEISLDGTASSDPDGAPLTYSWHEGANLLSTAAAPTVSLPPGTHTLSLTVSDGALLSAQDTVTVQLSADTEAPQLQVLPGPSVIACNGAPYVDPGATALDLCAGELTSSIATSSNLDPYSPGQYTVTYSVTDDAGHTSTATRELTVQGPCCIQVHLSDYNLFLLGDYQGGHHVEGRVAAGGDITLADFSVGSAVPSSSTGPALVAGRNLSLARGGVWGNAIHGGSYSGDSTVSFRREASVSQGAPIDFAARFVELRALSTQLARVAANGTTSRTSWGGVMLHGTHPQVNTFDVDASAFTGAKLLSIDAPAGSLVVLNIRGATASFSGFGDSLRGGIDQRGILYNFVDATSLTASSYSFRGTVLAPYAHVQFSNGSFDGGLYAMSLTGDAAGHLQALTDRDFCH